MTTPQENPSSNRRWLLIGGAVVVVLAIAGGLFWYLDRDVPEEASLEGALEAVADDTAVTTTTAGETATTAVDEGTVETTTTAAPADDAEGPGLDGAWAVDTSIGEFSFEEATATFVGFRIKEVLSGLGDVEAVGRTPEVSGTMEIEGSTITAVEIDANLDAIITNDSRRDRRAKGALNTGEFPTASFLLTEPIELGEVPADGERLAATGLGTLTINGIANPVEIEIEAQREGDLIVVVGSTNVVFSDWNVEVPSAPIVVSVEDNGTVELQLWFSR
ncbi:MAG TPA: YceI family protein [Acidimicrobiia bacterium]|jgi:polyisoprenoid-binding protein YceI|nr:YceI family protein [Acidimicrobiia bacterium]